jgi:hypothetical protein
MSKIEERLGKFKMGKIHREPFPAEELVRV